MSAGTKTKEAAADLATEPKIAVLRLSADAKKLTLDRAIGFDYPAGLKNSADLSSLFGRFERKSPTLIADIINTLVLATPIDQTTFLGAVMEQADDLVFFFGPSSASAGRLAPDQVKLLINQDIVRRHFYPNNGAISVNQFLTLTAGAAHPILLSLSASRGGAFHATSLIGLDTFHVRADDGTGEKKMHKVRIFNCRPEGRFESFEIKDAFKQALKDPAAMGDRLSHGFWNRDSYGFDLVGERIFFNHLIKTARGSKMVAGKSAPGRGDTQRFERLIDCLSTLLEPEVLPAIDDPANVFMIVRKGVFFHGVVPAGKRLRIAKKIINLRSGHASSRYLESIAGATHEQISKPAAMMQGAATPNQIIVLGHILRHFMPEGVSHSVFGGNQKRETLPGSPLGCYFPKPEVSAHDILEAIADLTEFLVKDIGLSEEAAEALLNS